MADDIKIGLDGQPLIDAAKPVVDALTKIEGVVDRLGGNTSIERLNQSAKGALGELQAELKSLSSQMGTFVTMMTTELTKAGRASAGAARTVGRTLGDEIAEGMEEAVAKAKVKISAPRMVLPNGLSASVGGNGIGSSDSVLAEARNLMATNGARTTQEIAAETRMRADMLRSELDSSRLTFSYRNNWLKNEQSELKRTASQEQSDADRTFKFRQSFYKSEQTELKRNTAQEQADADRTFKFRQTFFKNEQAELKRNATEEQADANRTFKFRQTFYKSEQSELKRTAAQEQSDANRTFQMRANYLKAEAAAARQAAASRLGGIDRDASFNASSRAGQLTRATRVASALGLGMSEEEAVTKYGAAAVAATRNLDSLREASGALRSESKLLAESQRDVQSAIRGAAGAAGAMYLTYGSLVPLAGAFFAASAVRESIQAFKDLEYQIRQVQALEESGQTQSDESIRKKLNITGELTGTDPVEAAKGLRMLAQSGLDAKQGLEALPVILETARVGELSVQQTTETLTGAVNAFGLKLGDMGRVGDVLAKAGAISNTSVGQMAESMKQASTVAKEYGVSIEDTSVALVALAKKNITGSAAGTSFANMMREFVSPTGMAKKAAEALNFSAFTKDGRMKDLYDEILPELEKKLSEFGPKAQAQLIAAITNNRGEKVLSALLGTRPEDLQEERDKLKNASGFVAEANGKIMDSLQGDIDRLKAAWSSVASDAGSSGSDGLRTAIRSLTETISSPEFQTALTGLVSGLASIASGAASVASAMANPIVQIGALGVSMAAFAPARAALSTGLDAVGAGLVAVGLKSAPAAESLVVAAKAAEVGATGVGLLSGAVGTMLKVFAGFTVVFTAIELLGMLHEKMAEKTGTDLAIANGNRYIENLGQQITELDRLIAKKREADGLGRSSQHDEIVLGAQAAHFELEMAKLNPNSGGAVGGRGKDGKITFSSPEIDRAQARADLADRNVQEWNNKQIEIARKEREASGRSSFNPAVADRMDNLADGRTGLAGARANGFNENHTLGVGTRQWDPNAKGAKGQGAYYANDMRELELALSAERLKADRIDLTAKGGEFDNKQKYERGLIDFKEYQAKMLEIQDTQSEARIGVAEKERDIVAKGLLKAKSDLEKLRESGRKDVDHRYANDVTAKQQELAKADLAIDKLREDQRERRDTAETQALKPTLDILKADEKSGALAREHVRLELAKLAAKTNGVELSEKEQYIQGETLKILADQEKQLVDEKRTLAEQTKNGVYDSADGQDRKAALEDLIKRRTQELDDAKKQISGASGNDYDNKRYTDFGKHVASTMETSLKQGLTGALTGDTTALANFGKSLQKTVVGALVDAFYDAYLKDAVKDLGRSLANTLRAAMGGSSGSSGFGSGIMAVGGGLLGSGSGGSFGSSLAVGGSLVSGGAGGSLLGSAGGSGGTLSTLANIGKWIGSWFDEGGYTGNGGKFQPMGVVHGGEFVVTKEATAKLGLGFLNSLNQFSDGGFVPMTSGPSMSSNPAGRVSDSAGQGFVFAPVTHVNVDSRSDRAQVIQDVSRLIDSKQQQYTDQLKRIKVLPQ